MMLWHGVVLILLVRTSSKYLPTVLRYCMLSREATVPVILLRGVVVVVYRYFILVQPTGMNSGRRTVAEPFIPAPGETRTIS
jgi:hypothetical protein